ncbi:unnamed protein product, partial [Protopolystoma xenopodis]
GPKQACAAHRPSFTNRLVSSEDWTSPEFIFYKTQIDLPTLDPKRCLVSGHLLKLAICLTHSAFWRLASPVLTVHFTFAMLRLVSFPHIHARYFNSTSQCSAGARTYECKPLPGERDHNDPDGWARRLFKLSDIRKNMPDVVANSEIPLLHLICRLKPIKGVMHYHKALLEKYGIGPRTKLHSWVVVKNTPSVNEELYAIKHLIRVQPIEFPHGLPNSLSDIARWRLLPNGRFVIHPISNISSKFSEEDATSISQIAGSNSLLSTDVEKILDRDQKHRPYLSRRYLREYYNLQHCRHKTFSQFFTSSYLYRLNQDGNEYRYSKLWRLDDAMRQSIQFRTHPDGTQRNKNPRFEADWSTYPWTNY